MSDRLHKAKWRQEEPKITMRVTVTVTAEQIGGPVPASSDAHASAVSTSRDSLEAAVADRLRTDLRVGRRMFRLRARSVE